MTTGNTGYVPPVLPQTLVNNLNINNPWWNDREFPRIPPTRRHLVQRISHRIDADIAPIVAIRGPRQVGKSTMQLQIISDLLDEGVPPRHIMRVQFDELTYADPVEQPILQIV
ncbi:MAG: AAA family ATPase, partial [Chloroflexi bacterium]|nr:AAA family ATPase [Chloroflexota bacterium]